jgi:hypothetical protein
MYHYMFLRVAFSTAAPQTSECFDRIVPPLLLQIVSLTSTLPWLVKPFTG